ncbi:MAG TPA: hypothetical protein VEO37_09145 [Thermoanaerobaculia bacterium]|nr:hypothetical protein [Thermoanaerobaculia bacterium]
MRSRNLGCAVLALAVMSLGGTALGATRTATSSIGVRVERHTGLYLPGASTGISLASVRDERLPDRPQTFGNSASSLLVSGQRPEAFSRSSPGTTAPRVVVTAFEP